MTLRGKAALLGLSLAACTAEPVVLATIPERAEGAVARRCGSAEDCPAGLYCDRAWCDAPGGECKRFPASCGGDEAPVCGCDGVTYFNDCLRRAAGIASARPGECSSEALACTETSACPEGAFCARLRGFARDPRACGPGVPGACWVLPARCPSSTSTDRWEACGHRGPGPRCLDTCEAIATERPFVRAARCP